jgi:LPXTG-site transpeptidase (sortase) family protein
MFGIQWTMIRLPRLGWVLKWGRNICLVMGTLILSYVSLVMFSAWIYQAEESRRFDEALRRRKESPATVAPPAPPVVLPPVSPPAMPPAELPSVTPTIPKIPVTRFAEGSVIGRMEVTRIGLKVMILEGITERTLQRAVGHFPKSPLPGQPGNIALAGHRNTFFSSLRQIRLDDEIQLTTLTGIYSYKVNSTKVVTPDAIEVLNNDGSDVLTLVTCYPFNYIGPAPTRFIVRAQKVR